MDQVSLTTIYNSGRDDLLKLALSLSIDPTDPELKRKIIENLRDSLELNDDFKFIYPKRSISLFQLVCQRLRSNEVPNNLKSGSCNVISSKIARNLIRVASTRIFSSPYQSFVEPIVNSIDAYAIKKGKASVGKFGFGFYSLFYWIIDSSKIELKSSYNDPATGGLKSWEGTINSDLSLDLRGSNSSKVPDLTEYEGLFWEKNSSGTVSKNSIGFKVKIELQKEFFGEMLFKTLERKLENISSVEILLRFKNLKSVFNSGNPDKILVEIEDDSFTVTDNASGISVEELTSLLIPSVSTKTVALSSKKYSPSIGILTQFKDNIEEEGSRLTILVGEIEVVSILIDFNNVKIIIQLSPFTQLPISRDDILMSNPLVKDEFEMNIFNLVEQALSEDPQNLPIILIRLLESYPSGKYLVPTVSKKILEKGFSLVPFEDFLLYRQITSRKIAGSDWALNLDFEKTLLEETPARTDLFVGKNVYFVEEDVVSFGKSNSLLFLGKKYQNLTPSQKADLTVIYAEKYLLPVGWKTQSKRIKELDDFTESIDDVNLKEIAKNLYANILGLEIYYKKYSIDFSGSEFITLEQGGFLDLFEKLIANYLQLISLLRPKTAYGESQPSLESPRYVLTFKERDKITKKYWLIEDVEKFKRFYIEIFSMFIPIASANNYLVDEYPQMVPFLFFWRDSPLRFIERLCDDPIEFLFLGSLFWKEEKKSVAVISDFTDPSFGDGETIEERIKRGGKVEEETNIVPRYREKIFNEREAVILLDFWRTYLRNQDRVEELLKLHLGLKNSAYAMIISPTKTYLEIHRENRTLLRRIGTVPPLQEESNSAEYYLSGLLEYVFQNNFSPRDFLKQKIPRKRGTLPLQLIEIAINEGTTKPALDAIIIETFQNSVDALRSVGVPLTSENLKITAGKTRNLLSYSISDTVGITPEGLLSLSVPFLSSKTAEDLNVSGEMGSGFYNVYRIATAVNIVTIRDKQETVIVDIPVIENERVVDIRRTIKTVSSSGKNGTTITIYFNSKNPEQDLTQIFLICQNQLATAVENLSLNKQIIHLEKEKIMEDSNFEFYVTKSKIESIFLTKGVPFAVLSQLGVNIPQYLIEYVITSLIINLKSGYQPTQSRTKITFQTDVSKTLESIFYIHILTLQLKNPMENIVENMTSEANIFQVLPTIESRDEFNSLHDFLWHYSFQGTMTLAHYIGYQLGLYDYGESFISLVGEVGDLWISKKRIERPKFFDRSESPKMKYDVLGFLQNFISSFWELIPNEYQNGPPPLVKIEPLEMGTLGSYNSKTHTIIISSFVNITKPPKNPDSDQLLGYIQENIDVFGKRFPSSTVLHELCHAWRNSNHSDLSSHGEMIFNNRVLTFDESANAMFDYVLQNGFFEAIIGRF